MAVTLAEHFRHWRVDAVNRQSAAASGLQSCHGM
jgi:hypothetical protein